MEFQILLAKFETEAYAIRLLISFTSFLLMLRKAFHNMRKLAGAIERWKRFVGAKQRRRVPVSYERYAEHEAELAAKIKRIENTRIYRALLELERIEDPNKMQSALEKYLRGLSLEAQKELLERLLNSNLHAELKLPVLIRLAEIAPLHEFIFRTVLNSEVSAELRISLLSILKEYIKKPRVHALFEKLRNDPDAEVRAFAERALFVRR